MSHLPLLIELGTEELPPKALKSLSAAFTKELLDGLLEAQLITVAESKSCKPFASPRRLGLLVENVKAAQIDQTIERRGPAVQAAFKEDGSPTPAALGFAKSCGTDVNSLQRLKTAKGEWLCYEVIEQGKSLDELLQAILEQALKKLPIPKRMRWGNSDAEFVRPVKWLIVLHGDKVVPASALDVESSNITRGHRFHSQGEIQISNASSYESQLLEQGHVIADFQQRQNMILEQINDCAKILNGVIEDDQELLDEVTGLVEYPSPIVGSFDEKFLEVPQECLISSMRDHQKYFHVVDKDSKLMPFFITLSNIQSSNPDQVKAGNEKVLRARLSDAEFFWQTDQKTSLESRINRLGNVLFHVKLGSLLDRTKRIETLAGEFAGLLNANKSVCQRGAVLAKADLVSDMVGEFDELQGIMGHYYADIEGEPALVGECIEQHYWPRFAGDQLPISNEAQVVALADKVDSFVGLFGAGEIPTGDKDPYGLRRAALSILRILIECEHNLALTDLVSTASKVYQERQNFTVSIETQTEIVKFIRGRLTAFYQAQNIATNTINSVMACEPDKPLDFERRVKAVHAFYGSEDAINLAAANKRISNILKKQDHCVSTNVDTKLFQQEEERALFSAIDSIESECTTLFNSGDYEQGLAKLASLRAPVDGFFDKVMVMAEDEKLKNNRLSLLKKMQALFLQVADIALLG
ncbi:MAG: glycine--tRNA ligase subunit beta [Gammaproteobacteria bacterium]|nr:glycine--tRNA ligase subunit beta [Gammaproteobacteria bacterium]